MVGLARLRVLQIAEPGRRRLHRRCEQREIRQRVGFLEGVGFLPGCECTDVVHDAEQAAVVFQPGYGGRVRLEVLEREVGGQ